MILFLKHIRGFVASVKTSYSGTCIRVDEVSSEGNYGSSKHVTSHYIISNINLTIRRHPLAN